MNASKASRRRLARALCDVPRGALHLLPYWARIAAGLGAVFPDIPQGGRPEQQQQLQLLPAPGCRRAAPATGCSDVAAAWICRRRGATACTPLVSDLIPRAGPRPAVVVAAQEEQLALLAAKRDTTASATEARNRCARYLGELVKFRCVRGVGGGRRALRAVGREGGICA
jgi:hypothetical protein